MLARVELLYIWQQSDSSRILLWDVFIWLYVSWSKNEDILIKISYYQTDLAIILIQDYSGLKTNGGKDV
jgi:hypothetical protein